MTETNDSETGSVVEASSPPVAQVRRGPKSPPPVRKVALCCMLLSVVMIVSGIIGAAVGHERYGSAGVVTASLAALVCWIASLSALLVVAMTTATPNALAGTFGATGLRTGIPLVAGAVLAAVSPILAQAGIAGMMLVFFLVSLTVETVLSVVIVNAPSAGANATAEQKASPRTHG